MQINVFNSIEDHRVTGRCTYKLADLLHSALLCCICGGQDFTDMSDFALIRGHEFGLFEDCGGMRPTDDTFRRLFAAVSPDEIERCLKEHGKRFLDSLVEKQVVIDGKKLRGSDPRAKGEKGNYLLNAFVSENSLILGQLPLRDKENEITAIPRLLDNLDIEGATVSIDAIGTQREIAKKILDKKAHYFLAVKDNQPALRDAVNEAFVFSKPSGTFSELEADHGRIEERTCCILPADDMLEKEVKERWPELKTLVRVVSKVEADGKMTESARYFISDDDYPKAAYFYALARGHWSIENQLHWHLDVTFGEDASRARKGYAAQNLSLLRKLALQGIKEHNDKRSLKRRMACAAMSNKYLLELLENFKI